MLLKVVLLLVLRNVQANPVLDLLDCITVPEFCPNKNITYWLYTRETPTTPHQLDVSYPETIQTAPFIPDAPFKILIHGYTGWKDYSPNTEIRPALFQHGEYNVISVDYEPIVKEPCYLSAVQNAKVVGNCTAQLIDHLVKNLNIPLSRFHVIGFSLGAHATGLIFEFLKSGQLERITGLDPALPLFWGNDIHAKLDKGDAKFVDVIHTNMLAKGKLETCGHVDFYCNGGMNQPGCDAPDVENVDSCNHARAPAYYAESINTKVGFWGKSCPNWLGNKPDVCKPEIMGFHTPKTAHGVYYLNTNSAPPFARGNSTKAEDEDKDGNGFQFEFAIDLK